MPTKRDEDLRTKTNMTQSTFSELWHKRLEHPSILRYNLIRKNMSSIPIFKDHICNECPTTKFTRLSFPKSNSKIIEIFELLHIDVCGKYKIPTHNNHCYFLTIVDDFSRATWAILLHNKGEATQKLKDFIKEVNNQFDKTLKTIRTDNRTEFLNTKVQKFLKDFGIKHQLSCLYTPQQNSVAEKKHRHILDIARCLINVSIKHP